MVLSAFGVDAPEDYLRRLCDCTPLGTEALKVVDAARQLGFAGSGKYTLTLEELENLTVGGYYPIVFVSLLPIDSRKGLHAFVVVGFTELTVIVLDPLHAERPLPLETFIAAWAMSHHLAILIER
jgi:ABC-type bacteriocin/lantibiotic exporter with double-glycine peptidase domain